MIDFFKKHFQHFTIWHIVGFITFFGIMLSMNNIFDQVIKKPNPVMELLNILENPKNNIKIKKIKPKIVRSIPTLYDLVVTTAENTDSIFF
ncbi:MAG: cell division protein FtsH, partial [Candidatus Phytoplasma australasiaticum]|nr:cell division protein FtsH [Candidatus Phytoplasma australasiaticum]